VEGKNETINSGAIDTSNSKALSLRGNIFWLELLAHLPLILLFNQSFQEKVEIEASNLLVRAREPTRWSLTRSSTELTNSKSASPAVGLVRFGKLNIRVWT